MLYSFSTTRWSKDGAIPKAFVEEFVLFAEVIENSANRQIRKLATIDNVSAAVTKRDFSSHSTLVRHLVKMQRQLNVPSGSTSLQRSSFILPLLRGSCF